jgi:hypothetical protein
VRSTQKGSLFTLIVFIGDVDCMDWSDEYIFSDDDECSFEPNNMKCDEHLCDREVYACGDGQCVS